MATIFIVDDDQAIGEMLSLVLENEGFQTVTCLDGLRAVEMFPIVKPDLILLDVMLPGLDGTGVARRIRATSNVPIIMLTAKSDTLDVVAGLEAGADDYVPKPFKVAELLARMHASASPSRPPKTVPPVAQAVAMQTSTIWNADPSSSTVWNTPPPRMART